MKRTRRRSPVLRRMRRTSRAAARAEGTTRSPSPEVRKETVPVPGLPIRDRRSRERTAGDQSLSPAEKSRSLSRRYPMFRHRRKTGRAIIEHCRER